MRGSVFIGGVVLALAMTSGKVVSGEKVSPALAQPAAAPAAAAPAAAMEVKIDNFKFGPEALTIAAGTMVTWTNRDDIPHTVVSTDGVFKSKVLDTDEKFSYTFSKPGTYEYFCSVHPKMTGKVIVQ
jgi:plastocyanin